MTEYLPFFLTCPWGDVQTPATIISRHKNKQAISQQVLLTNQTATHDSHDSLDQPITACHHVTI